MSSHKWAVVAIGVAVASGFVIADYLSIPNVQGHFYWLVPVLIVVGMAIMMYGVLHSPVRDEDL